MAERFDEAPVDLGPLERDTRRRASRITTALARRIARDRAQQILARWALPALIAAAASIAVVFIGHGRSRGEALAAFVLPRGPEAAWVTWGRPPDLAEVVTIAGSGR